MAAELSSNHQKILFRSAFAVERFPLIFPQFFPQKYNLAHVISDGGVGRLNVTLRL